MQKKSIWIVAALFILGVVVYQVNASRNPLKNFDLTDYSFDKKINSDSSVQTIIIHHEPETLKIYQERQVTKPALFPDSISFAMERTPLDREDIIESLDRELNVNTYWHSSTIMMLKKAKRYFPLIDSILIANQIPSDFKYLALIESGLKQVKSPAGAAGFWQLMKGTAKDLGLEVNKNIDERYHITKATVAACDYLKESYEEFENWTLVAASYNAGKRRIRESLKKQMVKNYYDLHLNPETARYVYRILAIKQVFENAALYGFEYEEKDLYAPIQFKKHQIKSSIKNLALWAKQKNSNYKLLKLYNPWIRKESFRPKRGKTYEIIIPKN